MSARAGGEPFAIRVGQGATAAVRVGSTTLGFDDGRSCSFDESGRLIRAYWGQRAIRRGLDNRFVERRRGGPYPWSGTRRTLPWGEGEGLAAAVAAAVRDLRAALPSAAGAGPDSPQARLGGRLDHILAWLTGGLGAERERFRAAYLPVPVLPPDQYDAVVVQVTEGCSHNACTFCGFYRDRPFHAKTPAELAAHLAAVQAFWGAGLQRPRRVFLGDANALVLPTPRLLEALEVIRAGIADWGGEVRGVSSFIDAFGGAAKDREEFRLLAARGLRRVYLGLESGSEAVLQLLGKPASRVQAIRLVRAVKSAGIRVGIIVLLGAGGDRLAGSHVTETLAALGEMALEDSDLVYLSPLRGAADSAYRTREAGADSRPLDEEGLFAQLESVRGGVQLGQRGGPKTAVYDIRDFLY